jgi:hypothetical protein
MYVVNPVLGNKIYILIEILLIIAIIIIYVNLH